MSKMESMGTSSKEEWLSDVKFTLESEGFEPFAGNIKSLFKGFKAWLTDANVDILLMCYQCIIGSLPELLKYEEIEQEYIKLVPTFIDNLGSQKTVIRKSTHRWIASYVKLSLKLELVLNYIVNFGLNHNKLRTRQHCMLVIPALLSLKKTAMRSKSKDIVKLVDMVANKLFDPSEIVQKTAK